jgi:hypothetical protein
MEFSPAFPLTIVPFPGEVVNLHIFELRYRNMITDCHQEGQTFGIIPFIKDMLMDYGVEMELTSIQKIYPNGEMDIRTKAKRVFTVQQFFSQAKDKLYPGAWINHVDNFEDEDYSKRMIIWDLLQELFDIMGVMRKFDKKPAELSTFDIAHHIAMPLEDEYKLLLLEKESERQDLILLHLKKIIPVLQDVEQLKGRIKMNGHFKNLDSPKF